MSVINDTTTTQGWPLPHPNNKLEDDVLRERQALQAVDAAMQAVQETVETKADSQATLQTFDWLQDAVEALANDVAALGTGKVTSVNGVSGTNIVLLPEHLKLGPANGPSSSSITYDAQGRISTMTQQINGKAATSTLGYDAQGRVALVQTTYNGRQRTETVEFDTQGRPTATTATEVVL